MRLRMNGASFRRCGGWLLLIFALVPAAVPTADADAEKSMTLVVRSEQKAVEMPVFWSLQKAGISPEARWYTLRLTSAGGVEFPVQLDDMNANGRLDGDDEIAALVDLLPGENTFSLHYLPAEAPAGEISGAAEFNILDSDGNVSIDNGAVKVNLFQWQGAPAKQNILAADEKGKWVSIASQYYDEPKFDNQFGGYMTVRREVKVIGGGPVRVLIRQLWELKNEAAGKSVDLSQEWHVFKGRQEILSCRRYANRSQDQALVFTQLNSGYYDITPGGRFDYDQDRFAGMEKGLLRSDIFKNGNFSVKPEKNGPVWHDVSCGAGDKPDIGIGSVVDGYPRPGNTFLGDIGRNNQHRLRMTEYFYPLPNPTLWPGKTYTFSRWYVVHGGDYRAVKNFAELRQGITVAPVAADK